MERSAAVVARSGDQTGRTPMAAVTAGGVSHASATSLCAFLAQFTLSDAGHFVAPPRLPGFGQRGSRSRLVGWISYFGLVFWLVRMMARRARLVASQQRVLLYAVSFGGTLFAILAGKLVAELLPAPFDLIMIAAVGLGAIAAFFAIVTT